MNRSTGTPELVVTSEAATDGEALHDPLSSVGGQDLYRSRTTRLGRTSPRDGEDPLGPFAAALQEEIGECLMLGCRRAAKQHVVAYRDA